jgi:hypothetical protein
MNWERKRDGKKYAKHLVKQGSNQKNQNNSTNYESFAHCTPWGYSGQY